MLLFACLLFAVCAHTAVKSQITSVPTGATATTTNATPTTSTPASDVHILATPNYPVAEGQTVLLECVPGKPPYSLQRLENHTWVVVSSNSSLTLTAAKDSGLYRCTAGSKSSQNYTAFIIALAPTVGEKLGTAAFVFSILTLILTVAILCWLCWQKLTVTTPISSTVKAFPAPNVAPQRTSAQPDEDRDVYMNYTHTNSAYTDLDPTNMTANVASVYSTLS